MCSKFGVLMFEVFDVRYFGVRSKTTLDQNLCQLGVQNLKQYHTVNVSLGGIEL